MLQMVFHIGCFSLGIRDFRKEIFLIMKNKETAIEIYDSRFIQEWCEKYNKTQEEYYTQEKEVWKMLALLGGRQLK